MLQAGQALQISVKKGKNIVSKFGFVAHEQTAEFRFEVRDIPIFGY